MARSNGSPRLLPNKIDRHIGERLREVRLKKSMTVADLAAQMGITAETLVRYESGDLRCPASHLFLAAQVLEVPVGVFFDGLRDD